ncbi:MAG: hypothetical protein KC503_23690, partial [Myxococcales bacterium]|nr:hypothetical protein [Myxococcales bacterium]
MKRLTGLVALGVSLLLTFPAAAQGRRRGHGQKTPVVMRVVPPRVAPGAVVTIIGKHFMPGTFVLIGRHRVRPRAIAPRRIVFVVPPMRRPGPRP